MNNFVPYDRVNTVQQTIVMLTKANDLCGGGI